MQKDSVNSGDGSGSEGVSGGVGVGASVFDVSTEPPIVTGKQIGRAHV